MLNRVANLRKIERERGRKCAREKERERKNVNFCV